MTTDDPIILALRGLFARFGHGIVKDRQRFAALLADVLPQYPNEQIRLKTASELGIVAALVASRDAARPERERQMKIAMQNLREKAGMSPEKALELANWVAGALGWSAAEAVADAAPAPTPAKPQSTRPNVQRPPVKPKPPAAVILQKAPGSTIFKRADAIAHVRRYAAIIQDVYTEIADDAFNTPMAWQNLTSISLPPAIGRIGEQAFANCAKLKEVILPKELKELDLTAFSGCDALEELVIPNDSVSLKGLPPKGLVLLCGKDSTAKRYCVSHGIPYRLKRMEAVAATSKPIPTQDTQRPAPPKKVFTLATMNDHDFSVKRIVVPNGYTEIRTQCFILENQYPNLETVEIPASVTSFSGFIELPELLGKSKVTVICPRGSYAYQRFADYNSKTPSQYDKIKLFPSGGAPRYAAQTPRPAASSSTTKTASGGSTGGWAAFFTIFGIAMTLLMTYIWVDNDYFSISVFWFIVLMLVIWVVPVILLIAYFSKRS